MDLTIDEILACLNQRKTRATYGAVGALLHVNPQSVGRLLGARRPEASWVVNGRTEQPTGYASRQIHPELDDSRIVRTGEELRALLTLGRRKLR